MNYRPNLVLYILRLMASYLNVIFVIATSMYFIFQRSKERNGLL